MSDPRTEPTLGPDGEAGQDPVEELVGSDVPLTGHVPPPTVKRFSRRAVGVVAGAVLLVTVLAIGHGLGSRPAGRSAPEAAAQSAPANQTPTDAISGLPGSYGDPKLERGAPARSGETASAAKPLGWALGNGPPPTSAPTGTTVPAEIVDREKREVRAREAGFSFAGGGAPTSRDELSPGRSHAMPTMPSGYPGANGTVSTASRDDDNRQDDKTAYLEKTRSNRWDLMERLQHPVSPYMLLSGTVLPGILITGINSDLPGQIEGQIAQNVYDTVTGQYLLLPQGTKLLGSYDSRITYGQSRVLVVWTRLVRPDGSSLDLEGMPGVDLSGYAGLTGRIDRHMGRLLTAVLLGSLIQAGTSAGTSYSDPSFSGRARQGAGQGVNDATQQLVRKELQLQPTIEVAPGARFNVFTTKDLMIPPYAS